MNTAPQDGPQPTGSPAPDRTDALLGAGSGLPSAFRWALQANAHPDRTMCEWLALEIVPSARSAAAAISDTRTTLDELRSLKAAFKALRQGATAPNERNRAARLYASTLAAAIVRFDTRITQQRDIALREAFIALARDEEMEEPLRDIARAAVGRLRG